MMQRRRFVKNISLASIGLSVIPLKSIGGFGDGIRTFDLAHASDQVRHGLFNPTVKGTVREPLIGDWIYAFDRFVLFDNGINAVASKDKRVHSLILGQAQETFQFALEGNTLHYWCDAECVAIDFPKEQVIYKSENFQATVISLAENEVALLQPGIETLAHAIEGEFTIDNRHFDSSSIAICAAQPAQITGQRESLLLMISKLR